MGIFASIRLVLTGMADYPDWRQNVDVRRFEVLIAGSVVPLGLTLLGIDRYGCGNGECLCSWLLASQLSDHFFVSLPFVSFSFELGPNDREIGERAGTWTRKVHFQYNRSPYVNTLSGINKDWWTGCHCICVFKHVLHFTFIHFSEPNRNHAFIVVHETSLTAVDIDRVTQEHSYRVDYMALMPSWSTNGKRKSRWQRSSRNRISLPSSPHTKITAWSDMFVFGHWERHPRKSGHRNVPLNIKWLYLSLCIFQASIDNKYMYFLLLFLQRHDKKKRHF